MGIYQPSTDLNLPPLFWKDLGSIVSLIVEGRASAFFSPDLATDQTGRLKGLAANAKQLLSNDLTQWQPTDVASVQFALAYASIRRARQYFGQEPRAT